MSCSEWFSIGDVVFHAQCTIMLTPRLPLYIPCAYVAFVYSSTVTVWRLRLPMFAQSAASGLLGGLFYCIYDLIGAKYLWWTWHDTDAAISERWLGVPIGSTMWTIVHCFCFTALIDALVLWKPRLSLVDCAKTTLFSALLTTPLMMLCMAPFQLHQLRVSFTTMQVTQMPGRPDGLALAAAIAAFLMILLGSDETVPASRMKWLSPRRQWDRLLAMICVVYCVGLVLLMALGHPEDVIATGVHQLYGECGVVEEDLSGYPRYAFLCREDYHEDYRVPEVEGTTTTTTSEEAAGGGAGHVILCGRKTGPLVPREVPPEVGSSWYTLCGKAHSDYHRWVTTETVLALLCAVLYSAILFSTTAAKTQKKKSKSD